MKNNKNAHRNQFAFGVCALAAFLGYGNLATAADPDWSYTIPAGIACSDFDLTMSGWDNPNRPTKEFYDKDGNLVKIISAGKGSDLLFTNETTGATYRTKANGSVSRSIKYNPDGTNIGENTGHTIVIMWPTDDPPGPSTTLYTGRVVILWDQNYNAKILQESGQKFDICAVLSK